MKTQKARAEQAQQSELAARGDGTPDHQTCSQFGFVAGTPQYSDCRLRINIAKQEAQQRQAVFEAEQARYEVEQQQYQARLAEYTKQKERQKGQALMQFGAALASGTSPYFAENLGNAGRISLGIPPVAPMRPQYQPQMQNFTMTVPSGRMISCTAVLNNISCYEL